MKKKILLDATVITLAFVNFHASAIELSSAAACVIDCKTGKCYYELESYTPLAPASMTKIMTVYLIYEKIEEGALSKDTLITADEEDALASRDSEATNVILEDGMSYTIDELIGAILVPSACAASSMVGKYISGSEESFAELMNQTAEELGLNAYYEDASGLSDNNRITARSMAELARILINKYPDVLNYTSKPYIEFNGRQYNNTNRMLPGRDCEYTGIDGLKTGTTTLAGCCFTATAFDGEIRLISVTMDSEHGASRFDDSAQLLDIGFEQAHFEYDNILYTDMKLFINNNEVPSLAYAGPNEGIYFILEDLKNYGFEIDWDPITMSVSAEENEYAAIAPIPIDIYRAEPAGSIFMPIIKDSVTSASITFNEKTYNFKNIHSLNGYTAVSADELAAASGHSAWNSSEKRLDIEL